MGKRLLFTLFAILFCSTTFGQNYHWTATGNGDYSDYFSINAVIQFDGVEWPTEEPTSQLELAAFYEDECRAATMTQYISINQRYMARLRVYGNVGQVFTLKLYDHGSGKTYTDNYVIRYEDGVINDLEIPFVADERYGTISSPATINFKTPNYYTPNTDGDNENISITAVVLIDGVEQYDSNLELGAFCGNVVKGSAKTNFVDTNNGVTRNYARTTVSGKSNDVITFRLYNHSTGKELEFTEVNTINFVANTSVGTILQPLEVNFITASYVAQIGENKYTTFEKAYEAAQDNDDIILLDDITLESTPTVISKDINITLGEYAITGTVELANTGATITGAAEAMTVTSGVEGYIVVCENNVYSLSERQPSGKVAYRAYINDSESREAVQVDLTNVYAKTSFVVELLDAEDNVLTTTSLKAGAVDAETYTCNIVLDGTASSSWTTEIKAQKLTVANIPATINVYADETLVDTYANALGAGTNVDETEKYKALDCVYKEAKIGETLYATFAAAYEKAATGNEIILLANVDFAETTVSKDININLNNNTVTGTIILANTGATVTCAEDAVNVTTSLAGYKVVFEDGMYKLVAKNYVAQVGDVKYESIQEAVDAAQAGNEIVVIAAIDGEDVVVDKNVTISGSVTLNDVSINAVEGADELTVSGLSFTGNSWINSGTAEKLTVSGVTANVTPSNTAYTNSRSAFISLGRSEQQQLELYVTNCNIVANGGADPILGWAAITKADIIGNTFGSESAYQTNSDCVKFMAIAQGAVFNITGNTIYSNYNGIVFGQNTTRDNAYTVNVDGNTFKGNADHIWIEVSGSNTTHATVKATSNNTVNGSEFTANDIKLHPNLNTFTSYAGVDVVLDVNGKVLGGTFKYVADGVIADGYKSSENADGTYSIVEKLSGEIAYRAYVTDTESVEAVSVDLSNVYASSSLKVELYNVKDAVEELLVTTTYAKTNFPIDADSFTCFMVLSGTPDEYWSTTINAEELTIENLPTVIKLYVDGELVDTFYNALGAGTNVDETEDYKALDCVYDYKVAEVGDKVYWNIDNAIANWTAGKTLTLLANVTLSDVITLKSTEHHILNLSTYTMTAAEGKNAIEIKSYGFENRTERAALTIMADETNPDKIGTIDAGAKSCIYYKYDATLAGDKYDRPIIYIEGGVYEGSTYSGISSTGHNTAQDKCATFNISGGTFNCGLNLTKTKLLTSGGLYNYSVSCTGGSTSIRLISGGTFKSWGWMTADAASKFAVGTAISQYNVGVYVDDKGYLVVGGPVITEAGTTFEAYTTNYSGWSNYLQYSSAATNGLYYTSAIEALADNNKTNGSVNIYTDELDLTSLNYKGTLVIGDDLTVTFNEGITPAWSVVAKEDGKIVVYTDDIENGIVKRTYSVIVPVAKIGDDKFFASLEAALAAATDECTIDLLADVEVSNPLLFSFNSAFDKIDVTFNGNGKTIKAVGTAWNDNTWLADIAWNVTLNNVTFDGNNTGCKGVQFYTSTSTLNNITVKNVSADKWGITDYAIHANASELTVTGSLTFEGCKHGMFMVDLGNNTGKEASVVSIDNNATVNGVKVILNHKDASLEAPASAADYVSMGNVPGYTMVYENGVYKLVAIEVQTITLEERWNWVSHYLVGNTNSDILTQLKNGLGTYGVQIKNQFKFTNYNTEEQSWSGSLSATSVTDMYKVNTSLASGETLPIQLAGTVVNPASHPIELDVNWNYIGYPLNEGVSVGTVFANVAKDGDYVKSQDAFAEYYGGTWHGNLKTMKPGEGYMYRNIPVENVDVTKTLVYSYPNAKEATEANITSENNYWVPVSSQYADNMTMVAMLDVKGSDYEVAAFVGGEVRGSSRPVYIESLDAYMFFLTIHGDEVEEMTFKVYDLATGEEYSIDNRMNYSDDAVVGSVRNPYMLTCSTLAVGENNISNISIYPNPTTTGNEINLGTECDTVEVFNALGVKVAEYQNVDTVDALETAGIYVIRITNDGNVQNCRLIVK